MERKIEDHWLELDGRRVFYRTLPAGPQGAGRPPLLLIHGITCCTETWAPFVEELGRRVDAPPVIVPDLPAHGKSARPDTILGMGDFGDWVERLLDRIGIPQVDVMGHSMGCQVALALAHLHPQRVRKAVLLGPTTGGMHVSTFRNAVGLMADSALEPPSYNTLLLRVFVRMPPSRYFLTIGEMQRDDAFQRARELSAPTLVIQGTRDAIIPKWVGRKLADTFKVGRYKQIAGAAHAAQFSRPSETADVVLRFLS